MALTFPLARAAFFDGLPIMEMTCDLPEAVELTRLGGGELLQADMGARLWTGSVTLGRMLRAEVASSRALVNALRQAGRSFLACDITRPGPLADPDGLILGGATPVIDTLPAGNRTLTLSGLPAAYILSPGDLIGWSYGSAPTRHALHEIVTGATASGAGLTGEIEVSPHIRPGVITGAAVTLIRPVFKAVLVPGSVAPGSTRRIITDGFSFSFQQTLR